MPSTAVHRRYRWRAPLRVASTGIQSVTCTAAACRGIRVLSSGGSGSARSQVRNDSCAVLESTSSNRNVQIRAVVHRRHRAAACKFQSRQSTSRRYCLSLLRWRASSRSQCSHRCHPCLPGCATARAVSVNRLWIWQPSCELRRSWETPRLCRAVRVKWRTCCSRKAQTRAPERGGASRLSQRCAPEAHLSSACHTAMSATSCRMHASVTTAHLSELIVTCQLLATRT